MAWSWGRYAELHCIVYRSIGLHREAEMIEQQLKMKQANGSNAAQSMAAAAAVQQQQAQQVGAVGGQTDYSKQWAEYYRSIGKIDEAEAIEKQIGPKVR